MQRGGYTSNGNGQTSEGEVYMDDSFGEYGGCDTCGPGCEGCCEGDACGDPFCECGDGMCGQCCDEGGCGECCEPSCGYEPSCGAESSNGCIDLGCGIDDPEACETVSFRVPKVHDLQVFGGVHGFKGPYDRDRDSGNFGFHEGFNAGLKVPTMTFGYQVGYQATHSQLNGDKDTNTSDPFTQQFGTVGLFRRNMNGWQGGVAYDVLHDERWGEAVDFEQVRGEVSFIDCGKHELGLSAAVHTSDHAIIDGQQQSNTTYQASDQYLLFYRLHSCRGGEGRIFGGVTDDDDGIAGADAMLPLHDRWSIQTGFTYLIPDADAGFEGASQEAWNIYINLVWHYKFRARKYSPYRPLFNVADNGSLIVDDRP